MSRRQAWPAAAAAAADAGDETGVDAAALLALVTIKRRGEIESGCRGALNAIRARADAVSAGKFVAMTGAKRPATGLF